MTNRSSSAPTDFTRGWELLAHFLLMLRASLLRHVLASLFVGALVGTLWFAAGVRDRDASIGRYVYGELLDPDAAFIQRQRFNGRSLTFLARQWCARAGFAMLAVFSLGAFAIVRHGRSIKEKKRLRGVELHSAPALGLARQRTAELRGSIVAIVIGLALQAVELGPRVAALPNYATAWAVSNSRSVARFLSPDETGSAAWYDGPWFFGFFESQDVLAHLLPIFRRSVPALLLLFTLRTAGAVLFGLLVVRYLRRWRVLSEVPPNDTWQIANVSVPDEKACYHFLFCGSPGSGKSTAIKDTLDQIRARKKRAIVYDLSGEYIEHFYREGVDLILNPLDARSQIWTPWADARTESDFTMLARSLFPPGGHEPFWADAGATLFAATMKSLKMHGNPYNHELHSKLTHGSLEELHAFLDGTEAARFLDPKAGAMPSNLIATVTSRLAAWPSLRDPKDGQTVVSIRDFVHEEGDAWLFLSTTEDQRALLKPLLSLWCDIAANAILTLPTAHEPKIWFVLDEVASLQRLPALPGLLERGRKHGCAALLGLQAMPQLEDAYGTKLARAIASQPQTWLVLRSVEPETARFLESALGQTEFVESQASYSMGAHAHRDGVSLQERVMTRPVALASEISSLPDLSGFLKLPGGYEIFRVSYGYKSRPVIAAPYVGRSPC